MIINTHEQTSEQRVSPVSMVNELSEQFNGRLSTIDLLGRHVEVVHEDDGLLAHLRAKHTLSALVQLGHDDILKNWKGVLVWDKDILTAIAIS